MEFCKDFLVVSILVVSDVLAQDRKVYNAVEMKIIDSYDSLLAEKVTNDLLINYKIYRDFPNKYWNFLNETLINNWDFQATTRALLGNEIFQSLTYSQLEKLSKSLELTIVRYAFESLLFYDRQKLNVIDIKINELETFAWLKINITSPRFPDIHLDLLLKRKNGHWRGVDFKFKGITYVNLKKNSYRHDFKNLEFHGLLKKLDDKNKEFFKDLCKSGVNFIDSKKPPCL